MRTLNIMLGCLAAFLLTACDFWPRNLEPLAESISQQVSGDATALLLGGDVLVIDVAGSPLYRESQARLEASATGIAEQAMASSPAPLESIAITFHEGEISDDTEKIRDFIFIVVEDRPVLQPDLDIDATGPLTAEEIQAAVEGIEKSLGSPDAPLRNERRECMRREVERLARVAGDPETLDPASMEYLSAETWNLLDAFGKRIILTQAITTQAMFDCVNPQASGRGAGGAPE